MLIQITGLAAMLVCAYTDYKTGRILNIVVFPAIVLCLVGILLLQPEMALESLKWGGIAWGITIPLILLNQMGGGDGKLLALAGMIYGHDVVTVLLYFCLLALLWFIASDLKKYSPKIVLRHLFFTKNFAGAGQHHNIGGLLIFLSSFLTFLKVVLN